LAGPNAPREQIAAAGWRLVDPLQVTATPWAYRDFIAQSRGEFGVAVNLEVKTRSGWFGDRNAMYLAMGKPVVIQDTGFSESLPCGEGLFAFKDIEDAVAAIESVNGDYERHCRAARKIAEEYFDSDKVLRSMLQACGLAVPR
jgi:glycosyltransferase involved in cell wall biosynthesis